MIFAVPNNHRHVSGHFMKAKALAFIDQNNSLLHNLTNPATNGDCSDKTKSLNLIKEMNADAVIVRNIGRQALGKLLSSGIRVFRLNEQVSLNAVTSAEMTELTSADQGRLSPNHKGEGGCSSSHCCGHKSHSHGNCSKNRKSSMLEKRGGLSATGKIRNISPVIGSK